MRGSRQFRHALAAAAATLLLSATAAAGGHWVQLAPFPEPTPELIGATVDGKIFVFGGLLGTEIKGSVYEYDPATDRWTRKRNMPIPAHHVMAIGYRGKVYIFGGAAQGGGDIWFPLNNAWEYNPADDSWKALAPMPTARGAGVVAEVGGKLYVIGGASVHPGHKLVSLGATLPHRSLGTNEEYDPATNTWRERSPMPTARNHLAVGVVSEKIYLLGGRVGSVMVNATGTDVVEEYDPATDRWGLAGARMPMPRSGVTGGAIKGKIYVAGGEMLDTNVVSAFRDFTAYDPARDSWEILPPLPFPLNGAASAVVGDKLYLISGRMQSGTTGGDATASRATLMFDPSGN